MHPCPHCTAKSIGAWRKVRSTPFSPAICGECGGASYVSGWSSAATAIAAEVLFFGSLFLAIFLGSPYGLLTFPLGLLAVTVFLGRRFPLIAASDAIRDTHRTVIRRKWLLVGSGTVILVLAIVHDLSIA